MPNPTFLALWGSAQHLDDSVDLHRLAGVRRSGQCKVGAGLEDGDRLKWFGARPMKDRRPMSPCW